LKKKKKVPERKVSGQKKGGGGEKKIVWPKKQTELQRGELLPDKKKGKKGERPNNGKNQTEKGGVG